MNNLRTVAKAAKGELWQIESIDLDNVEVKDKAFTKTEKGADGKDVSREVAYKVIIVDKKEYSIRERQLSQIKDVLEKKPTCKRIKFMRLDDGKIICLPLD